MVELANTEAAGVRRLNARTKRGRPLAGTLQPSDFPLQGIADRFFKDSTYREVLRRLRPHRQAKFPLAGFSDDPLDDSIWRQLTEHLPASSPYLTWTGGSEVALLDHLARTCSSLDSVEVAGVRMSRREAFHLLKEERTDSSSSPTPTPRRKRSRRRRSPQEPGTQAAVSYNPPRTTAAASTEPSGQEVHSDRWGPPSWEGWQSNWWSDDWQQQQQ